VASGAVGDAVTAGPTPDGIVVRLAEPSDLGDVARVLVAAFPREFHLLFGNRQRIAEEVTWHVLRCDYPEGRGIWVAWDGDRVIGAMLLESPPQFRQRRTWRLGWHVAWRHVGLSGLPRLALALLMPRYAVQAGEVYVRAIAVAAGHRRRGAGTLLLQCAEDWGRRHHKGWLGLHVNSENPRAHALYRRMGYVDRGYRSCLAAWITLRQRGSHYMTRALRETRG
jgi:ribosomal protein S18 acetylase RimI-like enzyme